MVTMNLNKTELREKTFNLFELNCVEQKGALWDSDPDIHYYNFICNDLVSCDHYLEDAFTVKCINSLRPSDAYMR